MTKGVNRRQFHEIAIGAAVAMSWVKNARAEGDVLWLSEVQMPPSSLPANASTLRPLLVDTNGKEIRSLDEWIKRREILRQEWLDFLGSLELDANRRPELQIVSEDRDAGVLRQLVRYEVEPDLVTEAYLLRPLDQSKTYPGAALFHSTVNHAILQPAGLGPDQEKAFGLKLAQRGVVSFCPRNFLWPNNQSIAGNDETSKFQQRHPRAKGMAKMLYDSIIAVNILAGLSDVDSTRLGAVGHSLGAKEVLYLAAFDDRIKATVSSEGGIGTTFSNWDAPWYLGPGIKQPDFRHEHHELLALVAPRAFLLIGGESADGDRGWPFIQSALQVYRLYGGTPRLGFYNHRQGHAVPSASEQRIYEWFATYL